MEFTPLSEMEILNLLPDGEYDFKVIKEEHHVSKSSGNESKKLTIDVYDNNGRAHTVFVYLTPAFKKLFKHFFDATGLEDIYKTGKITEGVCENRTGRCKVVIEEPEAGSRFDPKNVIVDFIKRSGAEAPKETFIDDKIPF